MVVNTFDVEAAGDTAIVVSRGADIVSLRKKIHEGSGATAGLNFKLLLDRLVSKISKKEDISYAMAKEKALKIIMANGSTALHLAGGEQREFTAYLKEIASANNAKIKGLSLEYTEEDRQDELYPGDITKDNSRSIKAGELNAILSVNFFNRECYDMYEGDVRNNPLSPADYYSKISDEIYRMLAPGGVFYVLAGNVVRDEFLEAFGRKFNIIKLRPDLPFYCIVKKGDEAAENKLNLLGLENEVKLQTKGLLTVKVSAPEAAKPAGETATVIGGELAPTKKKEIPDESKLMEERIKPGDVIKVMVIDETSGKFKKKRVSVTVTKEILDRLENQVRAEIPEYFPDGISFKGTVFVKGMDRFAKTYFVRTIDEETKKEHTVCNLLVDTRAIVRDASGALVVRSDVINYDILHEVYHMLVRMKFFLYLGWDEKDIRTKSEEEVLTVVLTIKALMESGEYASVLEEPEAGMPESRRRIRSIFLALAQQPAFMDKMDFPQKLLEASAASKVALAVTRIKSILEDKETSASAIPEKNGAQAIKNALLAKCGAGSGNEDLYSLIAAVDTSSPGKENFDYAGIDPKDPAGFSADRCIDSVLDYISEVGGPLINDPLGMGGITAKYREDAVNNRQDIKARVKKLLVVHSPNGNYRLIASELCHRINNGINPAMYYLDILRKGTEGKDLAEDFEGMLNSLRYVKMVLNIISGFDALFGGYWKRRLDEFSKIWPGWRKMSWIAAPRSRRRWAREPLIL